MFYIYNTAYCEPLLGGKLCATHTKELWVYLIILNIIQFLSEIPYYLLDLICLLSIWIWDLYQLNRWMILAGVFEFCSLVQPIDLLTCIALVLLYLRLFYLFIHHLLQFKEPVSEYKQ